MQKTTQLKVVKISASERKIVLPTINGMIFKKIDQVSFFKSDDIYCTLNDVNGNSCFVSKSLKWVETKLDEENFFRVHNCYFINVYNIVQYKKQDGAHLIMECGTKIPISRTKRVRLLEFLKNGH